MYDRILFPTDGSDGAKAVFDHVLDVAAAHDATVHVLNVADTAVDSVLHARGNVLDVLEQEGERIVESAADRANERNVSVITDVLQGDPARTIVDYADRYDVDLVAMPTHGRTGLEQLLLGSVTDNVLRTSSVPVLTLRPEASPSFPYRDVLLSTDGSDAAAGATEHAIATAKKHDATLHAIYVVDVNVPATTIDPETVYDSLEEIGEGALSTVQEQALKADVDVRTTVLRGTPHAGILDYATEHDVDLLVMGTHGRRGVERYLLGSVTERVVRTSDVPVLAVRYEPDE